LPFERLQAARKKTVGSRQTTKLIQRGQAVEVYVARDADAHVTGPIIQACRARGIPVIEVPSMAELGKACGIKVNCAAAAIAE